MKLLIILIIAGLLISGCSFKSNRDLLPTIIDLNPLVLGGFYSDNNVTGSVSLNLPDANKDFNFTNLNASTQNVNGGKNYIVNETTGVITFFSQGIGKYQVYLAMSFMASKTGTYHCTVFKNFTIQEEISFERNIGNANSVANAGDLGYVNIKSGDRLNVQCRASSGANPTITANHFSFNVLRVGRLP